MNFSDERIEGRLVIKPESERFDTANSDSLKKMVCAEIDKCEKRFALDLSDVNFIDSSGLAVLVSIRKILGSDGEIVLLSPSEKIKQLFTITRLDQLFKIF